MRAPREGLATLAALWLAGPGCARPTCEPPDYRLSECRVQAENELARIRSATGAEVRFQAPGSEETRSWSATGLLIAAPDGRIRARVATLGDFRLTAQRDPSGDGDDFVTLEIANVHPLIGPLEGEIERLGLTRIVEVDLSSGEPVEIRGELPVEACASGFELAAVGDIQTGPQTFRYLLDDLHREAAEAAEAGTPLLGLLLLGDLAEFGSLPEFEVVASMLEASPVPVAVTPGNHDIYATMQPAFNQMFGPGSYAFDVCDAHVVMLDSGNADLAPSVQGWLPRLLDNDQRFLLAGTHIPPYAARTSNGWRREDQAQHLLAELADRGAEAILAGHIHFRLAFDAAPVPEIIVGTGGASQRKIDPDYGYLRAVFRQQLQTCFVSVPAPGSPGPPERREPAACRGR